ncbi:YfbM family protein [Plantactinospora sp. WMMB334]|uniref:YfbM family protein n=1 Tax=Plantactinospora sp. WMMB334 TaxID=3404119 RepID=UPI003B928B5F
MSIKGNWLRVTPAELAQAKDNLDWALGLAESAQENEEWRLSRTDKAWNGLDFLLKRRGFTVPIVEGAEPFVDTSVDDPDSEDDLDDPGSDWGYGPPRYLTPEQVATAAAELAELTEDDLTQGVDPAELTRAQIYPSPWNRLEDLQWPSHYLPYVREFFTSAAKDGHAVICWLD